MDTFDDIRPYRDEEIPEVMKRLVKNELVLSTLRMIAWSKCPAFLFTPFEFFLSFYLSRRLRKIRSVDEFQKEIAGNLFMEWVISRSMDSLTTSGIENCSPDRSYIFVSNHRDIVLDSALLCHLFNKHYGKIPYIAFGDNLLVNELVSDLIRINKAFIVKRDLSPKEQFIALKHLSEYISHIRAEGNHFWISQKEGRSKDGIDSTNPAIIKMFYLAERKTQPDFAEFIRSCNIVPVAVSYEKDPCDRIKGWELYRKMKTGSYKKRKNEDLITMVAGISGDKGRVHLAFGEPLRGDFRNEKEVALAIDNAIHRQYRLWPRNYIAYDQIGQSIKYQSEYSPEEKEEFLSRFDNLIPEIRQIILRTYANPVFSHEAANGIK